MTGFVNVFGGSPVQPSEIAFREITLSEDITLTWPTSFVDTSNVVARIMEVEPTLTNLSITLPSALEVSVGADFLIYNIGEETFTLLANDGSEIISIDPGLEFYVWLVDNTTAAGEWNQVQFGAGTANAVASNLDGLGLIALSGRLNTNFPSKPVNTDYDANSLDRASLLVWNGGAGTITLPVFEEVGQGFYLAVNNQGTGTVALQTTDGTTIDGQASFDLNPGNSCVFIATSPNWNSLGFGQSAISSITALPPLNISGAAGGVTVLSETQYSNDILQFVGALTQNEIVEFPAIVSRWYVYNNTTNPFTVTARLGPAGNSIILPQGGQFILYTDATTLFIIPAGQANTLVTNITGTANQIVASAPTGNVNLSLAPQVNIATSLSVNNLTLSGNSLSATNAPGNIVLRPNGNSGVEIRNSDNTISGAVFLYNPGNTAYAGLKSGNRTTNTVWTLPPADATGTQLLASNGVGILSWTNVTVPLGGTGLASATPYALLCGGTTNTGALQQVASLGNAGELLQSNGAGALPSWVNAAANQAQMQAGTNNTVYVTPAVAQYHPSASKAWVLFDGTVAGTNAPIVSYNVTSVTTVTNGTYTINFTIPFSSGNYVSAFSYQVPAGNSQNSAYISNTAPTANSITMIIAGLAFYNSARVCATFHGDQ